MTGTRDEDARRFDRPGQRRIRHQLAVLVAREHAGEIEAKAVDAQLLHPVLEAMHDECADQRMVAVHRVAATGVVAVAPAVGCIEVIEDCRSPRPLKLIIGPCCAALRGVIENHVQQHADACGVQSIGQRAELLGGTRRVDAIARVRAAEAVGAVAPVVAETSRSRRRRHVLLIESHHRQQLHVRHAKLLQIGNLFDQAREGSGMLHAARGMAREAADVQLVDDRAVEAARVQSDCARRRRLGHDCAQRSVPDVLRIRRLCAGPRAHRSRLAPTDRAVPCAR